MYQQNKYVNELSKYSDQMLIKIASYCGFIPDGEVEVVRHEDAIVVACKACTPENIKLNKTGCRIFSDFVMRDGNSKNISKKYRLIMSKIFKDYQNDWYEFIGRTIESTQAKVKDDENIK